MFLARLDRARNDVQKNNKNVNQHLPHSPTKSATTSSSSVTSPPDGGRTVIPPRILHDLNEYLFDVFDANCMEEYHIMERFETKAMEYFLERAQQELNQASSSTSSSSGHTLAEAKEGSHGHDAKDSKQSFKQCKEYGHQEYILHNEFLQLFETLIDKFLQEQQCSADDLYEELRAFHRAKQQNQLLEEDIYAKYKTSGYSYESNNHTNTFSTNSISAVPSMSFDHDDSSSVICVQGDSPSNPHLPSDNNNNFSSKPTNSNMEKLQQQQDALEVLEVLSFYTDFTMWCEMMLENAKHRIKFSKYSFPTPNNSHIHIADHK